MPQLEQLARRRGEPPQAPRDARAPPVHAPRGGAAGPPPPPPARDSEGQLARGVARVDGGPDRQQQPPGGTGPEGHGTSPVRSRAGTGAAGPAPAEIRPVSTPSSPTFPGRGGE